MPGISLKYADMNVAPAEFKPGLYILQVNDIIEDRTTEGAVKFVMSHDIVGLNRKINFDNYVVQDADGTPREFGIRKLRAFIDAHKLVVEDVTALLLKTLTKGHQFKALLDVNAKGYPQIHFSDIFPMEYNKTPALNEQTLQTPAPTEGGVTDEDENIADVFTVENNKATKPSQPPAHTPPTISGDDI